MSTCGARMANAAVETGVVADLTHEAEGVVRGSEAGGKTVFVAGALPGERVSFRRAQLSQEPRRSRAASKCSRPRRSA